ncbi:restriction endonuclease [Crenalkalicoccus roseus]|uniref:restriction endonuclease n=1 Tax=Crenalkalicoccus roseus TaxID=1485588 RepID=UPI001081774B|nr:restriction endonuclease [Crenalkalicoccus roseus]
MGIPDYETLMLPLLRHVAAQGEAHIRDLSEALAQEFGLSEAERSLTIPSGKTPVIRSRAGWARSYLVQAGLLEAVRRGVVRLTERGRQVLAAGPPRIDTAFLLQFPEFREFRRRSRQDAGTDPAGDPTAPAPNGIAAGTPDDQIMAAVATIEAKVRDELLERLLGSPPAFFEQAVVDLLLAMGYGSTAEDAGTALGRSGDGGVDGVIREDRLGLDLIYIQAKRYRDSAVTADQLRSFAGALDDKGARKGVFITTSRFTADAERFAERQQMKRIVLIDGERLTRLMLRHDVGVRPDRTIVLKRIDLDYFEADDIA